MNYIIYCRKSSEEDSRQTLSLDSQESVLQEVADRFNLHIVKILRESKSAKEPYQRPVFSQMVKMIEAGKANAILCWKLDRLSRNAVEEGVIKYLLQKGKIQIVKTPDRDYRPEDNALIASVEFGMANQYIRDLSQNVKRGNRAKLSLGGWPNHAPKGYLNNKADKDIIIDIKTAHYVKKCFELYAKGIYTLKELADMMYQEGWRSKSGKKILRGHIHRILKNPFYYGIMLREGKYYEGKHEPLISKTLFDQANEVLSGKVHAKTHKLSFHLRGLLTCASCGCMLTASKKKGHDYYYCTNGKGECLEHKKYLRSETIDGYVSDIFSKLQFDEELIELAYRASKERQTSEGAYAEKNAVNVEKRLSEVMESQTRICDSFSAGNTPEALYNAKMTTLTNEEKGLRKQIKDILKLSNEGVDTLEPVKKLFLEANNAQKEYILAEPEQKRIIANNLLWNLQFQGQKVVNLRLKKPYDRMTLVPKPTDLATMLRD